MALVAVAADKGAPGVTTASLALAAVWPRPVLLAECDAAGGDLLYRLPAADGGRLDPQRGLLSLAVAARRGIQPHQVWRHTQKLHGGLDILTGLVDGPFYDLLAHACAVVLIARVTLEDVVRLRDRVIAVARGLANRRLAPPPIGVVVVADHKHFKRNIAEVSRVLATSGAPARMLGGLADEPKSAHMLRGHWGTRLDRSLLVRTARELAGHLARELPMLAGQTATGPGQYSPESSKAEQAAELAQPEPGPSGPRRPGPWQAGRAQAAPAKAAAAEGGPVKAVPAGHVQAKPAQAQAEHAHAGPARSDAAGAEPPPAEAVPQSDSAPPRPAVPSRTPAGAPAGGSARPEPASPDPAVQAPAPAPAPATPLTPGPVPVLRLQPVPGPVADNGNQPPDQVAGNGAPRNRPAQRKDSPNGQRTRAGG